MLLSMHRQSAIRAALMRILLLRGILLFLGQILYIRMIINLLWTIRDVADFELIP